MKKVKCPRCGVKEEVVNGKCQICDLSLDSSPPKISKKIRAVALLIFVVIISGFAYYGFNHILERDLDGEIFIVTKGGANIRLALVEIRILSKETAIEFVKLKQEEHEKERQRIKIKGDNSLKKINDESDPYAKNIIANVELATLKAEVDYLESDKFFFEGIPEEIFKTKTDIDGKFTLRVKRGSPGVLFAHGSRLVGGETEEYYWFLPIKLAVKSSTKISLNNENLFRNALHNFKFNSNIN